MAGPIPGGPPPIPHDVLVKQKQGQATMIWAIGAWVDLNYLKEYLEIKRQFTGSVSLDGNGYYAFPKSMSASGSGRSM